MSFKNLFSISLDDREEEILAALYLLGKKPNGKLFCPELRKKIDQGLLQLKELPEAWGKDLAVSVLENNLGEDS